MSATQEDVQILLQLDQVYRPKTAAKNSPTLRNWLMSSKPVPFSKLTPWNQTSDSTSTRSPHTSRCWGCFGKRNSWTIS